MIKELKTCEICGKPFKAHHRWNRFCGRACSVIGRSGPTRKHQTQCHCHQCGKEYFRSPIDATKSKFCGIACMSEWRRHHKRGSNNPNFKNAGWKKCIGCGKQFKHYSTTRRFCSALCSHKLASTQSAVSLKRGLETEKQAIKKLSAMGYKCTLSQRSRGAWDIIAISALEILLVQVKYTKEYSRRFTPKTISGLISFQCPSSPLIRKWILCLVEGRGWFLWENGNESTI